jgi:hypothetical protein
MTFHPSHRPVSALRARMIEDMNVRGFTEKTRNDYVRNVRVFCGLHRQVARHRDGKGLTLYGKDANAERMWTGSCG